MARQACVTSPTQARFERCADHYVALLADTVEKLLFRSDSKNSRPVEASLLLGRGGPLLQRHSRVRPLRFAGVPDNGIRRLPPCIARAPIGVKLSVAGHSLEGDA